MFMSLVEYKKIKSALVVSAIYSDNIKCLDKINKYIESYDIIILNGCLFYPYNQDSVLNTIKILKDLEMSKKIIYNIASLDLKISLQDKRIMQWARHRNNVINLLFERGSSYFIFDGGINDDIIKKEDLNDNMEVSFINNEKWHHDYSGNLGYIITNKPYYNKPKFFNYSCSIGYEFGKNKVTAQEVYENGLGKTLTI